MAAHFVTAEPPPPASGGIVVGAAQALRETVPFPAHVGTHTCTTSRPYCLPPQGVIATLRRVSLMVSSIRGFVEAGR